MVIYDSVSASEANSARNEYMWAFIFLVFCLMRAYEHHTIDH
jgi:hypothetical protein